MKMINIDNIIRGIVIFSWVYLFSYVNIIGVIEGYINPVVTDIKITYENENKIYGVVNKVRSCDFVGMEFYIKNNNEYQIVSTEIPEYIPKFDVGEHKFGPMNINVDGEVLKESKLRLFHECSDYFLTKNIVTVVNVKSENLSLAYLYK